jgi:hypothetical protein
MTPENLGRHSHMRWAQFWCDLKPGYDLFAAKGFSVSRQACHRAFIQR